MTTGTGYTFKVLRQTIRLKIYKHISISWLQLLQLASSLAVSGVQGIAAGALNAHASFLFPGPNESEHAHEIRTTLKTSATCGYTKRFGIVRTGNFNLANYLAKIPDLHLYSSAEEAVRRDVGPVRSRLRSDMECQSRITYNERNGMLFSLDLG
ncbi:hypothetical protein IW261DRAFT_1015212 [Armillaria novae-zelandiae]|uniref:Uncharacterized protein n=1 Tax=Armillaria novae-zelandiae TaxID=153914 RepID=A0AA39NN70_9AGAR|nr:hypothetical protein IW261DRAFT_1015212 [Armillaria novae-zelandiae]